MKYYAVQVGRVTGVYNTWDECKSNVDGFSGAVYKSFNNYEDACKFIDMNPITIDEVQEMAYDSAEETLYNLDGCESEDKINEEFNTAYEIDKEEQVW